MFRRSRGIAFVYSFTSYSPGGTLVKTDKESDGTKSQKHTVERESGAYELIGGKQLNIK